MTIDQLKAFLLWTTAINYGVLLIWFGVFVYAHDWIYRTYTRWFKLSAEKFDVLHYVCAGKGDRFIFFLQSEILTLRSVLTHLSQLTPIISVFSGHGPL